VRGTHIRATSRLTVPNVDALYLLIPLSVLVVLGIGAVLAWSALSGQFDDLDVEGRRILDGSAAEDKSNP